jgi:phosphoglycerate dehydrogenase-like enzyme
MKLIIPHRIADQVEPRLPADCTVVHVDQDGYADGDLSDAEVYLRWWTPAAGMRRVLEAAPQLRWLHTPSAGVDQILTPELVRSAIVLTNSAGAHAIPIAEFVMLFMLGLAKHVRDLAALTPENAWPRGRELRLAELHGKVVLILGLGNIGVEIARRATAFGLRVFGSRRHPAPVAGVERVVGAEGWRDLLPEADFVVIATPLTQATRRMVDAGALARMKRGAYLINIARGEIVDTEALIAALHGGWIAGAALDALPEEPLPPEHPLWSAPNTWITPHISWSSPHTGERASAIFLDNLRRFRAGEPLVNVVDKSAGY